MLISPKKGRFSIVFKTIACLIALIFSTNTLLPSAYAQISPVTSSVLGLPVPGTMVLPTEAFMPPMIKGITFHTENPMMFDFIIHPGDDAIKGKAFEAESKKLIKYFLAALTTPEDKMWVNLSPYEKDRIIPDGFSNTEMGRDLLAQDYILKQLTSSLMYPEDDLGKQFWERVYSKVYEKYGATDIPIDTFNKVWIVPESASIYQRGTSVFVVESKLKVLTDMDYRAMGHESSVIGKKEPVDQNPRLTTVIKEIIIPAIEKEVNTGKTFANLRQIYNAVILATWYKKNLKKSFLYAVYADRAKTNGIELEDKEINQKIYEQYLEAFRKGVYNYIKEEYDPKEQSMIPRRYFSGGMDLEDTALGLKTARSGKAMSALNEGLKGTSDVAVRLDVADRPAEEMADDAMSTRTFVRSLDRAFERAIMRIFDLYAKLPLVRRRLSENQKKPLPIISEKIMDRPNTTLSEAIDGIKKAGNSYRFNWKARPNDEIKKRFLKWIEGQGQIRWQTNRNFVFLGDNQFQATLSYNKVIADEFGALGRLVVNPSGKWIEGARDILSPLDGDEKVGLPPSGSIGQIAVSIDQVSYEDADGEQKIANVVFIEDIQPRRGYGNIKQRYRKELDPWRIETIKMIEKFAKENDLIIVGLTDYLDRYMRKGKNPVGLRPEDMGRLKSKMQSLVREYKKPYDQLGWGEVVVNLPTSGEMYFKGRIPKSSIDKLKAIGAEIVDAKEVLDNSDSAMAGLAKPKESPEILMKKIETHLRDIEIILGRPIKLDIPMFLKAVRDQNMEAYKEVLRSYAAESGVMFSKGLGYRERLGITFRNLLDKHKWKTDPASRAIDILSILMQMFPPSVSSYYEEGLLKQIKMDMGSFAPNSFFIVSASLFLLDPGALRNIYLAGMAMGLVLWGVTASLSHYNNDDGHEYTHVLQRLLFSEFDETGEFLNSTDVLTYAKDVEPPVLNIGKNVPTPQQMEKILSAALKSIKKLGEGKTVAENKEAVADNAMAGKVEILTERSDVLEAMKQWIQDARDEEIAEHIHDLYQYFLTHKSELQLHLLKVDGNIVARQVLEFNKDENVRYLNFIETNKEFKGKGYGRKLLRSVVGSVGQNNNLRARFTAFSQDPAVRTLWRKYAASLGFDKNGFRSKGPLEIKPEDGEAMSERDKMHSAETIGKVDSIHYFMHELGNNLMGLELFNFIYEEMPEDLGSLIEKVQDAFHDFQGSLDSEDVSNNDIIEMFNKFTAEMTGLVVSLKTYVQGGEEGKDKESLAEVLDMTLRLIEQSTTDELHYENFNLEELLNKVVISIPGVNNKKIQVKVQVQSEANQIKADKLRIRQVLTNLVKNAVESMSENGSLNVSAQLSEDGKDVFIRVSDTGEGISDEDLEHIFDPYFTTKGEQGTGVGLAISRQIIEAHGGELTVESQKGVGTTFTISIPQVPSNQAMAGEDVGGIDLNPNTIEMNVEGEKIEFEVPNFLQGIDVDSIQGLVPVIINITPVTNIPLLLGVNKEKSADNLAMVK